MNPHSNVVLKPFIDEIDIKQRVEAMVKEIAADFKGDELIVIGVLKGSFMFLADLVRHLYRHGVPLLIDFLQVSSYGSDTVSSGKIVMIHDIATDIEDKYVLLADDILDTGRTSAFLKDHLSRMKPASLKTCMFLDKPKRRAVPFKVDYVGFRVPDAFIVGYGLDFDNRYRERPYLSLIAFKDEGTVLPLDFQIRNNTVFLEGRLDAGGVEYVRETLLFWKGNLNLDLKDLNHIDSAGFRMLLTVSKKITKSGNKMHLVNLPPKVREAFTIGGFDKTFQI
jgi:hypoxanthine phosphoribosyltransferase